MQCPFWEPVITPVVERESPLFTLTDQQKLVMLPLKRCSYSFASITLASRGATFFGLAPFVLDTQPLLIASDFYQVHEALLCHSTSALCSLSYML